MGKHCFFQVLKGDGCGVYVWQSLNWMKSATSLIPPKQTHPQEIPNSVEGFKSMYQIQITVAMEQYDKHRKQRYVCSLGPHTKTLLQVIV